MDETGKVISVGSDGSVTVAMKRTSACERCGACITVANNNEEMRITARNDCAASAGDKVRVELDSGSFLKATLILYGLPLVGFLTGCLLGILSGNSLVAFGAGIGCAAIAYAIIRRLEPKWKEKGYTPVATKKL